MMSVRRILFSLGAALLAAVALPFTAYAAPLESYLVASMNDSYAVKAVEFRLQLAEQVCAAEEIGRVGANLQRDSHGFRMAGAYTIHPAAPITV